MQPKMAELIKMLFEVNTYGDPWNIVLDVVLIPHRKGKESPLLNFGTPSYFQNG